MLTTYRTRKHRYR